MKSTAMKKLLTGSALDQARYSSSLATSLNTALLMEPTVPFFPASLFILIHQE